MPTHFRPRHWLSATVLTLTTVIACASCTIPTATEHGTHPRTDTDNTTQTSALPPGATISPQQRKALRTSWSAFRTTHPGIISLAILPVGATPTTTPLVVGTPATITAGATLRAPIAVAAIRFLRIDAALANNVVASLNSEDENAAQAVWDALGHPTDAAHKTTTVLRLAGDTQTHISLTHPEHTTPWSLPAQARFAAELACMPDASFIRDSLQPGSPQMSYGFGTNGFHQVLSGWTVRPDTPHTVVGRQFAIVNRGRHGFTAVAVSAQAPDGSRTSAEKLLTAVAQWLQHTKAVPAGRCL